MDLEARFNLTLSDERVVEGEISARILVSETGEEEVDNVTIEVWVYESDADEDGKPWHLAKLTDEQKNQIETRAHEALGRE